MKSLLTSLSCVAILGGAAAPAFADGYFEGVGGIASPIADDDYDNLVDGSLKLGVRAGSGAGPLALELTADATLYDDDLDSPLLDASIQRYRALLGARYRIATGTRGAQGFVRAGVGADILAYSATTTILNLEFSETDVGLALEVGAGLHIPLGKAYLGAQFALPMGFHFNEDDPNDAQDADLEYTAIDIDFLLTAGTTF